MMVQAALRSAVRDALLADIGLYAALGGSSVYDDVPATAVMPYVRIGEVTSDDDQHWLAVHAFSQEGRERAHIIAGALVQALDDASLTLEGYHPIKLRFAIADIYPERDGHTYHALVRFVAVLEESK